MRSPRLALERGKERNQHDDDDDDLCVIQASDVRLEMTRKGIIMGGEWESDDGCWGHSRLPSFDEELDHVDSGKSGIVS